LDAHEAVAEVWRTQRAKLWRSLVAFSGDPELASDSMSEAFAQALGREAALVTPERWIWRTAFRIATGELADRGRRRQAIASSIDSITMAEPIVDLVTALRTLSPNQRAVAVLRLYADMPTREVARVLGCTPATVRVHLAQARRRLRPLLEDDDD